jgi:hypothetical protein
MTRAVNDPETALDYLSKFREYGIRVIDGGDSKINIGYCPWCGVKLPASLRDRWFEELEKRGIDPAFDVVPEEFSDERWFDTDNLNGR